MRPSQNVGDSPQGQQKQPESSTQEHVGVPPAPQSEPTREEPGSLSHIVNSLDKSHQSSDDESSMSDQQEWGWYPDIRANDQAKWRRTALAKPASPGGTTTGNIPSSKKNIDFKLHGNAVKPVDGSDKSRESLVKASTAKENSDSTQASGMSSVRVVLNDENGALAD